MEIDLPLYISNFFVTIDKRNSESYFGTRLRWLIVSNFNVRSVSIGLDANLLGISLIMLLLLEIGEKPSLSVKKLSSLLNIFDFDCTLKSWTFIKMLKYAQLSATVSGETHKVG